MSTNPDRRFSRRIDLECPITFSRFNSKNIHRAVAKNYTPSGMYFEADTHFSPGAHLIIHRQPCSGPFDCAICERVASILLTEVRWSEILEKTEVKAFGMGVKTLTPY